MTHDEMMALAERRIAGGRTLHLEQAWEQNADDAEALARAVLALAEENGRLASLARLAVEARAHVVQLQAIVPTQDEPELIDWINRYDAATRREECDE